MDKQGVGMDMWTSLQNARLDLEFTLLLFFKKETQLR